MAAPAKRLDSASAVFLAGYFAGGAGAALLVTALGKQVYDLSGRELDLGFLGLAEFAPAAFLVLVTGSVADRFDRRRVASLGLLGETVAALLMTAYVGGSPTAVGPLVGLTLLLGSARAFVHPAARSLPADLVPSDKLPWLVSRWTIVFQAALVVGPILAGSLFLVDVRAPFVAAAVLLLASSIAFWLIPRPATTAAPAAREPRGRGFHEAFAGLRIVRRQPVLLGAISLDLFAVLFGGAVALLPAIAEDRLGVGPVGFGWLRAAPGIGASLVMLVLAIFPARRRVGPMLLLAVGVFGLATVVLGVTRSYAVAFGALLVLAGADALSVYIRVTLVPLVTPATARGRVLAVENVFIGASNELGAFESGVAGQFLGPGLAVGLGGVVTMAIAVAWWLLFPALRNVDRFPDPDESQPTPSESRVDSH